jgi:hypothetical protein
MGQNVMQTTRLPGKSRPKKAKEHAYDPMHQEKGTQYHNGKH